MIDPPGSALAQPAARTTGPAPAGAGRGRLHRARNYVAFVPFLAYVGLFLIVPTLVVAVGSFLTIKGDPTLDNIGQLFTDPVFVDAFVKSIELAVGTAIIGAILGGLLAWAVAGGTRTASCVRWSSRHPVCSPSSAASCSPSRSLRRSPALAW